MKKAILIASAVLASAAAGAQTVDNWRNAAGDLVWKNGTNEYLSLIHI